MNNYTNKDLVIIQTMCIFGLAISLALLITLVPVIEDIHERLDKIENNQITQNSH